MDQRTDDTHPIDRQIAWTLAHTSVPEWLKLALRGALGHDPVDAANLAELLRGLLAARAARWAEDAVGPDI